MELQKDRAERLGMVIHWGFGAVWSPVVAIVSRAVLDPFTVGILTGVLVWLLFDESANTLLGLAAPPWRFPASAHVRAFANHLV